jgi:small GTP-binding protein
MFPTVLDDRQAELWRTEKRQVERLLTLLAGWEARPEDLTLLRQALAQLDELFLLVVVGEFNSGKSALINALLGEAYLAEGVTPTTSQIHVLKQGPKGPPRATAGAGWVITHPAEFLREINIVDTPGTNAVLRQHETIVRDFVPRSDLVVFVTSADRPFTQSEREFLEAIRDWGKKVVLIVNKIDILSSDDDVETVTAFVRDNARSLLGISPPIFALSARQALQAKLSASHDGLWTASRFGPFEQYLSETLDEAGRVRLKLLNPLGVADRLAGSYAARAQERYSLLHADLLTLDAIDAQIGVYQADMAAEFERRLSKIDNLLLRMRARGEEFFDNTLKLRRLMDLLNSRRLQEDFAQVVVADAPEQVEAQVQEIIDWLMESELRQWQAMGQELGRRQRTEFLHGAAEEAASGFEYNRRQLLENIGRAASQVVARYDRSFEARKLAEDVQDSLAQVALVEVGAVGLGVLLKALLVSATADATGILAAGVVGALGLAIIPYKRSRATADLRAKVDRLRDQLHAVLNNAFHEEIDRSGVRLREAMEPYSRFVRAEHSRLMNLQGELAAIQDELRSVRAELEA